MIYQQIYSQIYEGLMNEAQYVKVVSIDCTKKIWTKMGVNSPTAF